MKEVVILNGRKEDLGARRYIASDGKEIACYYPAMEEKWGKDKKGRDRILVRARPAMLSFNSDRLDRKQCDWKKPVTLVGKPEYQKDIAEIVAKYPGVSITEHSYL